MIEQGLIFERDGRVLTNALKSQNSHPSWECEFLGERLNRANVPESANPNLVSDHQHQTQIAFLEDLKTDHSDGHISSELRDFWYSRTSHHPSEEQVQLALKLNNPVLVLEATVRNNATNSPDNLGSAITKSIQFLSELFGITELREILSIIPIDHPNDTDDKNTSKCFTVLKGVTEFLQVITLHGGDQFADKHVVIQFDDTLRFDQCEISCLTPAQWQLRMSPKAHKILLMPSRVNWLLVNQSKLIASLVEHGSPVRLCLADGADEVNVPADERVTIAFCGHRDILHRIILVEDTYSAKAKQLLGSYPEPLSKGAARAIFDRRTDKVFWRGSTTGSIRFEESELEDRMLSNHRVRFCLEAQRGSRRIDALITNIVQVGEGERQRWSNQLQRWEILGPRVTEAEFLRHRYYVDLDGNSAAWGTIQKYLGLCLVIKPTSKWTVKHHERLIDGENFLQISSPTVVEVESAINSYDEIELFEIAYSGHLMAHEYLRSLTGDPFSRITIGQSLHLPILGD
jgi:hypothetical protein